MISRIIKLFNEWYHDWINNSVFEKEIVEKNLEGAVNRSVYLSFIFAVVFTVYGFTIVDYLKLFKPDVTLWSNVWPRFVFNTIPFILLGLFIKKIGRSNVSRVMIWIISFSVIMNIASWVNVWPIVLSGKVEVLGLVHAANLYTFAMAFVVIAPPNRYLLAFLPIVVGIYWIPLATVAYLGNNPPYFNAMLGDILHTTVVNFVGSSFINQVRVRALKLEALQRREAEKFLGSTVSKAIFNNRGDLLDDRVTSGFVVSIDIRGYTGLLKQFPEQMISKFIEHYHEMVSRITDANGGVVHKTAGDGHLICFGILDEKVDLSDIPDIEDEEKDALYRRNSHLITKALMASEEIVLSAKKMAVTYLGVNSLKVGIGIDYGDVHVKVFGSENMRKELDVFGIPINCATRLEAHTKLLELSMEKEKCYIVISPAAAQFLDHKHKILAYPVNDKPVRDFPDIKELFIKAIGDQSHAKVIPLVA